MPLSAFSIYKLPIEDSWTQAISWPVAVKIAAIKLDDGTNETTFNINNPVSSNDVITYSKCVIVQSNEATTKLLAYEHFLSYFSGGADLATFNLAFTEATQIANWMSASFTLSLGTNDTGTTGKTCYYNYKVLKIKHI